VWRWLGGVADVVFEAEGGVDDVSGMIAGIRSPDVLLPPAGIWPDGVAAGGAPVLYGVRPGPPGFGPGKPTAFPPDGLVGCAPTAADNAIAAIAAMPVKRYFI
jgi:hypothetical protein